MLLAQAILVFFVAAFSYSGRRKIKTTKCKDGKNTPDFKSQVEFFMFGVTK